MASLHLNSTIKIRHSHMVTNRYLKIYFFLCQKFLNLNFESAKTLKTSCFVWHFCQTCDLSDGAIWPIMKNPLVWNHWLIVHKIDWDGLRMALLKYIHEILIRYSKWPHVLLIKSSNDYIATLIIEKSRHVKNICFFMLMSCIMYIIIPYICFTI